MYTLALAIHLLLTAGIFSALVLALAWELEARTAGADAAVAASARAAADLETPATATAETETGSPTADPETSSAAAEPETSQSSPPNPRRLPRLRAYLALTKPKLMWLLCLVAVAAMAMAGGRSVAPSTVGATLFGGVLAVGASGTFNNVLERDRDGLMARTADRPMPNDRIPTRRAAAFGVALAAGSVAVFVAFVNPLAAALGLLAILFYSVGYTLVLKPNTDRNVVLGGAVGAFPALIGWAAVTNAVELPALALGGVVFLWTPAHFYNLALAHREDYARADVPMLPVVRGEAVTRKHVLLYLGATLLGTAALAALAPVGWTYATATAATGGAFLRAVVHLHRERTDEAAVRTFHTANAFLGAVLLATVLDSLLV